MENYDINTIDAHLSESASPQLRRRQLLPWWIKIFCWIFIVLGVIAPVGLIFGLLGKPFDLSLYGISTSQPLTMVGLAVMALFVLKGIAGCGLWMEKGWAVPAAIADAIIGVVICLFLTFVYPFLDSSPGFRLSFRLELILLFPYLLKLVKIWPSWIKSMRSS